MFRLYAYFSTLSASRTDLSRYVDVSETIFLQGEGSVNELVDTSFLVVDDANLVDQTRIQAPAQQIFVVEPNLALANEYLLVKLDMGNRFFFGNKAKAVRGNIKNYIEYKKAKEGKEKKEKIKVLFHFSTDEELALVLRWFVDLSISLGSYLTRADYNFYIMNVKLDRKSLAVFNDINLKVGLKGVLVEQDIEKFKVLSDGVQQYQLQKSYLLEPFSKDIEE